MQTRDRHRALFSRPTLQGSAKQKNLLGGGGQGIRATCANNGWTSFLIHIFTFPLLMIFLRYSSLGRTEGISCFVVLRNGAHLLLSRTHP
jgi:hypothetical protein